MARGKSLKVFKRETALLEFMKNHKGKKNLVSSNEIRKFLSDSGCSVTKKSISGLIINIMYERNAPICYVNAKGYYWAQTREEIENTIADMESRIASLNEHIEHLRNFVIR